jgi:alkylhydroperoxidase/carboxymuconolactone decarboxylase family protein YurZ
MPKLQKPPKTYSRFIKRFPAVGKAWELAGNAGREGPLDDKTARLIKLAISIGMMREGAVHSAARKAIAAGVTREQLDQVVALGASSLGFPATVAIFSWIDDCLPKRQRER